MSVILESTKVAIFEDCIEYEAYIQAFEFITRKSFSWDEHREIVDSWENFEAWAEEQKAFPRNLGTSDSCFLHPNSGIKFSVIRK